MIQSKPWDFMVKYTPQREWIEGHGILVAFALFFGGIAGGLYLASLYFSQYFDSRLGMLIAMILAVVTGITDMAHLSKPTRAWRMAFRPNTSWIARGFIVIFLFIGSVAIQLALSQWAPGVLETIFMVISAVLAFGVAIYSGFVLGFVSGIKIWNTAIVPVLFVVAGLMGGLSILLLLSQGESAATMLLIARFTLMALVVYAVSIIIYLWGTTYGSSAARNSVRNLLKGSIALVFWLGVAVVGVIVPVAILTPFVLTQNISGVAFIIAAICAIIGGICLRYSILKAGVYTPLVPAE